jgi:hypothetical protein
VAGGRLPGERDEGEAFVGDGCLSGVAQGGQATQGLSEGVYG